MRPKKLDVVTVGIMVLLCVTQFSWPILAQKPGQDIKTVYGFISRIPGAGEPTKYVTLTTPIQGENYEIKVYFLKVETSAALIDAHYDGIRESARKSGEDSGSVVWDAIREQAKSAESEAQFEVFDAQGKSIGKVKDIGLLPLFKTVKFEGKSSSYRVKVECVKGAGLFRLVLQYK